MTNVDVALERRLLEAFADARETVAESPDLFARVTRTLDEARSRRRFRWRLAAGIGGFVRGARCLGPCSIRL